MISQKPEGPLFYPLSLDHPINTNVKKTFNITGLDGGPLSGSFFVKETIGHLLETKKINKEKSYIPCILDKNQPQKGHSCGIAALSSATGYPAYKEKRSKNYPRSLRQKAKQLGATYMGALFDIRKIQGLLSELKLPGKVISVDQKSEEAYIATLCQTIKAHNTVMVSVDIREAFPAKAEGNATHWALVVGFVVTTDTPEKILLIVSQYDQYYFWSASDLYQSNAALPEENPRVHLYYDKRQVKIGKLKDLTSPKKYISKVCDEETLAAFSFSVIAVPVLSPNIISSKQFDFFEKYVLPLKKMIAEFESQDQIIKLFGEAMEAIPGRFDQGLVDFLLEQASIKDYFPLMDFFIQKGAKPDIQFVLSVGRMKQEATKVRILLKGHVERLKHFTLNLLHNADYISVQRIFNQFPMLQQDEAIEKAMQGKPLIYIVAEKGLLQALEFLLDERVDLTVKHHGKTALEIAIEQGHHECVNALRRAEQALLFKVTQHDAGLLVKQWIYEEKTSKPRIAALQLLREVISYTKSVEEIDQTLDEFTQFEAFIKKDLLDPVCAYRYYSSSYFNSFSLFDQTKLKLVTKGPCDQRSLIGSVKR